MASFDVDTFFKVLGGAPGAPQGSPVDALGMAFGMPTCMLGLAKDALGLLPGDILGGILGTTQSAKESADRLIKQQAAELLLKTGVKEFLTETGIFKFLSDNSKNNIDKDGGSLLGNLGGILGALQYGAGIYANIQATKAKIDSIKGCIDSYKKVKSFEAGSSAAQKAALAELDPASAAALFGAEFQAETMVIQETLDFMDQAQTLIDNCVSVLQDYALHPENEPVFFDIIPELSGTNFNVIPEGTVLQPDEEESVFDLVFGPPKSKNGQFLLTVDGLYYDSQSGGLDPALLEISKMQSEVEESEFWKFEQDPAAGGKGVHVTLNDVKEYTDTIFDPDIVDDSPVLQGHYDADHFLNQLLSQKNKDVYDLSAQITEILLTEAADSAIVTNFKESQLSILAQHNEKINRRKKQIELAVRLPSILDPEGLQGIYYAPGNVPINDFSYLSKLNFTPDIGKQETLIFTAADVVGLVKPITPKFVVAPGSDPDAVGTEHLAVPTVGKGSISYTPGSPVSGTNYPILSLADSIEVDKLLAVYNFLETDIVDPSSTDFQTLNCANPTIEGNAQLVASSISRVFTSGLGVPYLEGIVDFHATNTTIPNGLGSYVKLPDTPEFRDLAYGGDGFTVESWVHMPTLGLNNTGATGWDDAGASALHRILLGCENTGSQGNELTDDTTISPNNSTGFTKGMLIGFTRDNMMTSGGVPNASPVGNMGLSFYAAPTQSMSASNVGFINSTFTTDGVCVDSSGYSWQSMKADVSTLAADGTTRISDSSAAFVLMTVTFDPQQDAVSIYADGSLVTTSAMTTAFGLQKYQSLNVPTFAKNNSFEYGGTAMASGIPSHAAILEGGPKLNKSSSYKFTPWIIGGGYTDGMYDGGNFMGSNTGISSGLRGYVGSVKFYQKPLSNTEVLQNYNAQQGFFKNIQV